MVLAETWFALAVTVPTSIVVTFFIASVLKELMCSGKPPSNILYENAASITSKTGNKLFSYCGVLCLFSFWIRATVQATVFTILAVEDRHQQRIGTALGTTWFFYGLGLWLMLVSFVLRIQYTLKGTHLQYSPAIIIVLYILLGLLLGEVIVIAFIDLATNTDTDIDVYFGYVTLVSHFLFSSLLVYLLFSKIFVVMQQRLRERVGSDQATEMDVVGVPAGDQNANQHAPATINQISLTSIDAVTRYALLMSIGIISTYFINVLIFIDIELSWSISEHILTWSSALVAIDLLVNATAVFLLFEYNSKKYNTLCKTCHGCSKRCCVNCVYWYSNRSKHGAHDPMHPKNRQEFATLILAPDDDTTIL